MSSIIIFLMGSVAISIGSKFKVDAIVLFQNAVVEAVGLEYFAFGNAFSTALELLNAIMKHLEAYTFLISKISPGVKEIVFKRTFRKDIIAHNFPVLLVKHEQSGLLDIENRMCFLPFTFVFVRIEAVQILDTVITPVNEQVLTDEIHHHLPEVGKLIVLLTRMCEFCITLVAFVIVSPLKGCVSAVCIGLPTMEPTIMRPSVIMRNPNH